MFRTVVTVLTLTIAVFLLLPGRTKTPSGPGQEIRHYLELGQVQEAVKVLEKRILENPQDLEARRELVRVIAYQPSSIARPVLAEQFKVDFGLQELAQQPDQLKGGLGLQELDHTWFFNLGRHTESTVRLNVATCIGDAKMKGGLPMVIRLGTDENRDVRVAATRALGELAEEKGRFTLLCALKDGEWLVRSTAANALGRLRPDETTTRALFRVTQDSDEYVRFWAQKSLMATVSEKNAAAYRRYLTEGEPRQRQAAILSLTQLGDREVLPDLQEMLVRLEGKEQDLAARVLARKAPDACHLWINSGADLEPALATLLKRYLSEGDVKEDVLAGSGPGAL